jgi:hypothetical protein
MQDVGKRRQTRARQRLRDFNIAPAAIFRVKRVKQRADSSNKS